MIERPASVVKELAENAIDAAASRIAIAIDDGGRGGVLVADDGSGIAGDELPLAVLRHATSKLAGDDLVRIATLGFRGEALPSIGAVSRLRITSRAAGATQAFELLVEGGAVGEPRPAALAVGTRVEVRDLFYRTPARLKFLRSARTETEAVIEAVRRLALAHPHIGFTLEVDGREALDLPAGGGDGSRGGGDARDRRLRALMGRSFLDNAIHIEAERDRLRLEAVVGLPTLSRKDARLQYFVVNGRPVQDRLLKAAFRVAYADLLFHDRQALGALFLDCPAEFVDVNVHPTKAEVRFRDPALVRGLLIGALKRGLAEHGHRASGTGGLAAAAAIGGGHRPGQPGQPPPGQMAGLAEAAMAFQSPAGLLDAMPPAGRSEDPQAAQASAAAYPLGAARAQLFGNYIVAEGAEGLVIVDQHAAHERIVYEGLKEALAGRPVERQALLVPEVVELTDREAALLEAHAGELAKAGLVLERFGSDAILVREVPAMLGAGSAAALVRDLASDLAELGRAQSLAEALERVAGTMACHGSVRAGRHLTTAEMNALLRGIETGRHTGQCIHGRPTYIQLKISDIERLFGRR